MAERYSKTLKEDKKVKIIGLAVGKDSVLDEFNQTIVDLSSEPGTKNEKYYFQTYKTKKDLNKIVDQLVGPLCVPEGKFWYTMINRIRLATELDADIIDFIIYAFVLVYAKNGRFIVTCVLFFAQPPNSSVYG